MFLLNFVGMFHWLKIYESEEALNNNILLNRSEVFSFKGEKICLTHTINGFFAVQDRCPHNGAALSKGACNSQGELVCPLHRYTFNLELGKATSGGSYSLKKYELKIKDDGVFLGVKAKWWET